MSQYFEVHPKNPQARLIAQAVKILKEDGVVIYPTDTSYAIGCALGGKESIDRIRRIRGVEDDHHFSLLCRDLAEISTYARVDNPAYRLMKNRTPGPYTFVLHATNEVPRRLQHPKRKTIGIRVPDHPVTQALLTELDTPLMSSSLVLPGDEAPLSEPDNIRERTEKLVDLIIDSGVGDLEPSSVLDLSDGEPKILREGKGDVGWLQS